MTFLLGMPVIVKVLGALFLILVCNNFGHHLALSLLAGTVALALWSGHAPFTALSIALERMFSVDHALLLAVAVQVIWLSDQMARTNVMADLVSALRSRLSKRTAIAVLPAVIGFLPMPGGALFSAPLVADCDRDHSLDPLLKTRINYWFRHVWEYWWPLYPGILLLLSITGLDAWQIMVVHLPLSIVAILSGWYFLLRPMPHEHTDDEQEVLPKLPIFPLIEPILAVIAVYVVIKLALPAIGHANRYLPMMLGLLAATGLLQFRRPLPWSQWQKVLLAKRLLDLCILITLVRMYGAFIEARLPGGVLLVEQLQMEFRSWGIPIFAVTMAIPFVCGIATGLAVGFVGAGFPIVMSILGPDPSMQALMSTTVLAYGCGYMGMMLSPVHICLIVTNEHFETALPRSIGGLVRPAALVVLFTVVYSFLVGWILG